MLCPNCGKEVRGKWCGYCGTELAQQKDEETVVRSDEDTSAISPENIPVTDVEDVDKTVAVPDNNDDEEKTVIVPGKSENSETLETESDNHKNESDDKNDDSVSFVAYNPDLGREKDTEDGSYGQSEQYNDIEKTIIADNPAKESRQGINTQQQPNVQQSQNSSYDNQQRATHFAGQIQSQQTYDRGVKYSSNLNGNHFTTDTQAIYPSRIPESQSYNYDNSAEYEDTYTDDSYDIIEEADKKYYGGDALDDTGAYDFVEEKKNNKTALAVVLTICFIVLIAGLIVLWVFVGGNNEKTKDETTSSEQEKAPQQTEISDEEKNLRNKADQHMRVGAYDDAEDTYSELMNYTEDEEIALLYNILHNFNTAKGKADNCDYDKAEEYYNKIPLEYKEYEGKYDIVDAIDDLKAKIDDGKKAYDIYEEFIECMKNEDYTGAREQLDILDDSFLKDSDKNELTEKTEKLEEKEKEKEEKEKKEEDEATKLLEDYCKAMVKAINEDNFSLVSKYIDSSSDFYNTQKEYVEYCVGEGITEEFVSLEVLDITKINDTTWEVSVEEEEKIYYNDGDEDTVTYNWVYTITKKNSKYYVSDISE